MYTILLKKIALSLVIAFASLWSGVVYAAEPVTVYFFHGDGCPHCAKEEEFLGVLEEREDVEVVRLEVWSDADNRAVLVEAAKVLETTFNGVPVTIVGERAMVGWGSEETSGVYLLNTIEAVRREGDVDIVAPLLPGYVPEPEESVSNPNEGVSSTTTEPIATTTASTTDSATTTDPYAGIALPESIAKWGSTLSLPLLTVLFGALDGFNPCAMWALVFLITLLFGMKDKKRMWILGSAFIFASGAVYYLFMAAWLNLIVFLGFIVWIRALIGLIAIAGGAYYLYEWRTAPEAGCKVTNESQKEKLIERMKKAIGQKSFLLALVGIVIVAALINLVELVCSAGLPAAYAQVLALHSLSPWQYYAYLLLYVIVFMLDDMVIFGVAMTTLSLTGIGGKYTRVSHLIGGALMILIGLLLIFKPEVLLFG
jgi:glutaredoxin